MFEPHYGDCIECKKSDQLIVVKAGLCQRCNYKKKQDKKKSEGKKTGGYKYVRKVTGEGNLFEDVLNNLDDEATTCFVCGIPVPLVTHFNLAHVLAKGKYPAFRLNPDNIRILCYNIQGTGCHSKYDHSPHSELKGEGWEKLFELRDRLKKEYKISSNL